MKEKLIEIIKDIIFDFNVEETALLDGGILSSLDVLQLIVSIKEEFGVSIPASAIKPENFNSVDSILNTIETLSTDKKNK